MDDCEKTLNAEEQEDNTLRQQHGQKWNRPPSSAVNGQYKQQIADYRGKMQMAQATDGAISQKYESNKAGFALLSKTRQDLASQIPQTAGAGDLAGNPSV